MEDIIITSVLFALVVFCIFFTKHWKATISTLLHYGTVKLLRNSSNEKPLENDSFMDKEISDAMTPVILAYQNADESELPPRMDKTFLERTKKSLTLLKRHGVQRVMRSYGLIPDNNGQKGKSFKKWNEFGREWREGTLMGSMLDSYVTTDGSPVFDKYYPKVRMRIVQSRHVRFADAKEAAAKKKDKFGYTKNNADKIEAENLYEETRQMICPSCGADLEIKTQQETCPFCGAQIFSNFHDWQTESLTVEPEATYPMSLVLLYTAVALLVSLLVHVVQFFVFHVEEFSITGFIAEILLTVGTIYFIKLITEKRQEKLKKSIVRFSEHQFKSCVYEELWKDFGNSNVVDFSLGDITIKKVDKNDETTELTVSVPVNTRYLEDKHITSKAENKAYVFWRATHPDRLKGTGKVIEEKECPSCGSNFIPDEHGCCSYCGFGLRTSNAKWKLKK